MDRERYKRLIMFFASLLVIGLQTANFAYIWFTEYNRRSVIQIFYWRRGNWVLIGQYNTDRYYERPIKFKVTITIPEGQTGEYPVDAIAFIRQPFDN